MFAKVILAKRILLILILINLLVLPILCVLVYLSDVPDSSDDFCNHRPGVCSGAGVASAGMQCAGVDNTCADSKNVDGVVCTVKSDSVDYIARPECKCNDAIVCECNAVAVEVEEMDPKVTESRDEIRKL